MTQSEPPQEPRTEHRREPRESCQVEVMVCDDIDGQSFEPAQMVNRSSRGVAILFARPIHPGQRFLLKKKDQYLSVAAYAARHCRRVSANTYIVGGELLHLVGEHAMKQ